MLAATRKPSNAAAAVELDELIGALDASDESVYALAELLRAYQNADVCVVVIADANATEPRLYRADQDQMSAVRGRQVDAELARWFLTGSDEPFVYHRGGVRSRSACVHPSGRQGTRRIDAVQLAQIANLLETDSFMSLPLVAEGRSIGRVHLGTRGSRYSEQDLASVAPMVVQVSRMIETQRVAARRALEVAREERKRISRDLHDSTVQPYIGVKLGLEALRRKVEGIGDLAHEVDELINMAGDGISELRQYVGKLKRSGAAREKPADGLLPALRRQAHKFSEFYGIETRVLAEKDIPVAAALHDEIIHIVREGLSNVRRHTSAREAAIRLRMLDGSLRLEIVNDNPGAEDAVTAFVPRSIDERARELGGRVQVRQVEGGRTLVAIELPL